METDSGYLVNPDVGTSGLLRSYGLPGYTVHNFRCGLNIGDRTRINLGLENMGDKKYRDAHSRSDAEGRNFWLSVEFKW